MRPLAEVRVKSANFRGPTERTVEPPVAEEVSRPEEARRLDATAMAGLVLELKVAALKNDTSTFAGVISGLKKFGRVGRAAVEQERALAQDPKLKAAFDAALEKMP
jgi:hypothetical protein